MAIELLNKLLGGKTTSIPEQWKTTVIGELPLLALDLELTSLDAKTNHITSCGWIKGKHHHCELGSARHYVMRTRQSLAQSPCIHGITEEQVAQGHKLTALLDEILDVLSSNVCVFHHASLDISALRKVCDSLEKPWPPCLVIDTLLLAKYFLQKTQPVLKHNDLTLDACRRRFELRSVEMHNALDDALATIELFFAFEHEMKVSDKPLSALLHTGAIKVYQ